jgi:hypothetical protein
VLVIRDEERLIEGAWESAQVQTQLPAAMAKSFFAHSGPMRGHFDNRRSFHRYYLRDKALLTRGESLLGVYTKDVSRQGICLLSPLQLFPKERVELWLPNGSIYQLQVVRCRRECDHCFDCGTRFTV